MAAIARSFQVTVPESTTINHTKELAVPSLEREIRIYFPEATQNTFPEVAPVTRVTARPDVAEFALAELLQGPTVAEQDADGVKPLTIQLLGESVCEGRNFNINLEGILAIVQFCRTVIRGGIGEEARLEESIRRTFIQFPTITDVALLDKDGTCLIDLRDDDDCLARLPTRYR